MRGMVRGLVGTMLQAGRGNITVARFREIIAGGDNQQADFAAPAKGLFLEEVIYPAELFQGSGFRFIKGLNPELLISI